MSKQRLRATVAALAFCTTANPAWGQQAPTSDGQKVADPSDAAQSETETTALGDIIVTATRRDERLQQVPISITAVSGDSLAKSGITNTLQLTQTVPALNVRYVNFAIQPIIRGVGSRGTTNGDETNVAFYVDGIYQVAPSASSFDLLNIDRIEVLRGPQGTLFGRNATGGLINVITRDPTQETHFKAVFTYGRFNERSAQFYATTGISDTLAIDLSGRVYEDDGYIRDIFRNRTVGARHTYSVRSRLFLHRLTI